MLRHAAFAVFALAAWSSTAPAQVIVQTPWVTVRAGRSGVSVDTYWFGIDTGPLKCAPKAKATPALLTTGPTTPRAQTLAEFATTFQPKPGNYEVELLHPGTGQPVKVAFTLPDGTPSKVHLRRRALVFDYGRRSVGIHFLLGGRVRVDS
jgi:hypothetical protein